MPIPVEFQWGSLKNDNGKVGLELIIQKSRDKM